MKNLKYISLLLLAGGLIYFYNALAPAGKPANSLRLQKNKDATMAKPTQPAPFSVINDVIIPLIPSLSY